MDYGRQYYDWGHEDRQEEPWRVAKYKGKRLIDDRYKNHRRPLVKETTFFIGNLPADCTSHLLWEIFIGFGTMSDAYVPRKRDKKGNRFGFIRFKDVRDAQYMAAELGTVRIDQKKVFVKPAKFAKEKEGEQRHYPVNKPMANNSHYRMNEENGVNNRKTLHANDGRSYAEVITGIKSAAVPENQANITMVESEASKRWRVSSLVAELRNPFDLKHHQQLLKEDGLFGFTTKYLGGLRLLLTFEKQSDAMNFLDNQRDNWEKWFKDLFFWDGRHLPFQRLAKLQIRGVPLQFWGPNIFDQIGNLIGSVVFPSKASDEDLDLSVNTVSIITNKVARINSILTIAWHGNSHEILISEDNSDVYHHSPVPADDRNFPNLQGEYGQSCSNNYSPVINGHVLENEVNINMVHYPKSAEVLGTPLIHATNDFNNNKNNSQGSTSTNSNLGPVDTPPPPPQVGPSIMGVNDTDLGLRRLFDNGPVLETPPSKPKESNPVVQSKSVNDETESPDPFNLRELLQQVRERAPIDLNIPPKDMAGPSRLPSPNSHHTSIGKKAKYRFPSMKMKDTLWVPRNGENSKNKSRGSGSQGGDVSSKEYGSIAKSVSLDVEREVSLTKDVGECLGFNMEGKEDDIRKQVVGERGSNNSQ
ncbi:putative RNA recognition motif domain, nucleotide-binding alpha-beta plait domain superfamily [Helianthus debilis subsp. tardiflorus]